MPTRKYLIRQSVGFLTIGTLSALVILCFYKNYDYAWPWSVLTNEIILTNILIVLYQFLILFILSAKWMKGELFSRKFTHSKLFIFIRCLDIVIITIMWILMDKFPYFNIESYDIVSQKNKKKVQFRTLIYTDFPNF